MAVRSDAKTMFPALLALPAEVAESRGPKGNAREAGRLPGLAGRQAVTICRQIEGVLCCPALTSAPRQANGRVNRARPATRAWFSPACTPVFFAPCIPGTKRLATSGDVCAIFSSTLAQCLPLRTTDNLDTRPHPSLSNLLRLCRAPALPFLRSFQCCRPRAHAHCLPNTCLSLSRALSLPLSRALSLFSLVASCVHTHSRTCTHTFIFPLTHA